MMHHLSMQQSEKLYQQYVNRFLNGIPTFNALLIVGSILEVAVVAQCTNTMYLFFKVSTGFYFCDTKKVLNYAKTAQLFGNILLKV